MATTTELRAVEAYFRRLVPLAARLHRVDAAMAAWRAHEADRALPPLLRRDLPAPDVSQETLNELRTALRAEIGAWEQRWLRRN